MSMVRILYFIQYGSLITIMILIIYVIYFRTKYPVCPICGGLSEIEDIFIDNRAKCPKDGEFYIGGGITRKRLKIVLYWKKDCFHSQEIIKFLENNYIPFDKKNIKRLKHRQELECTGRGYAITPALMVNGGTAIEGITVFDVNRILKKRGIKELIFK